MGFCLTLTVKSPISPQEEQAHGRQNYSDLLPGDDLLKAMHRQEDRQCQMNDAEIMTTTLIAALFFRGHHESARPLLKQYGYIPHMVSKSRFSRRLHRIKELFDCHFQSLSANLDNTQYRGDLCD